MSKPLSIAIGDPTFTLEKSEFDGSFDVRFTHADAEVTVHLRLPAFESLILQGQALISSHNNSLTDLVTDKALRQSASVFKRLDDESLLAWLREMQGDSLILLLWYLKDRELAKAIMRVISQHAAEMLTDDLCSSFRFGVDPDKDPQGREAGRCELEGALSILYRLADDGQARMPQ